MQNPKGSDTTGRKMLRAPFSISLHHRVGVFALLFFVLVSMAWAGPAKNAADKSECVVAIGDVHGDFDDFVTILQTAGLIDAQHHLTSGVTGLPLRGGLLGHGSATLVAEVG